MVSQKQIQMNVLLTLIVPRHLADMLADELMLLEQVSGFTQDEVLGFTRRPQAMTTAEQVVGRQQKTRFELLLTAGNEQFVLNELAEKKIAEQIHFSVIPVHQHQHGVLKEP
ncbi:MAG: hypothetical protein B7X50_02165 [Alishewanella sp. 34-51-39]|nr:MAG: hypothetical protein B7X50_02165 [Alishewanella sp. 34-51-39]